MPGSTLTGPKPVSSPRRTQPPQTATAAARPMTASGHGRGSGRVLASIASMAVSAATPPPAR
jgi:hypothetical protein